MTESERIETENGQTAAPSVPGQRSDTDTAADDPQVLRVVAAWTDARNSAGFGPHRRRTALAEFTDSARALISAGASVEWLVSVAAWMGTTQPTWVGLAEATTAQYAGAPTKPAAPRKPDASKCSRHPALPLDCPTCFNEAEQRRTSKPQGMSMAEILAAEGVPWQPKIDA